MDSPENKITLEYLCEKLDIKPEDVTSLRRCRKNIFLREIFAHIFCRMLKTSSTYAAKQMNRHHSTVLNALNKFDIDYKYDSDFKELADGFFNKITIKIKEEPIFPFIVGNLIWGVVWNGTAFIPFQYKYGTGLSYKFILLGACKNKIEAKALCRKLNSERRKVK